MLYCIPGRHSDLAPDLQRMSMPKVQCSGGVDAAIGLDFWDL